MSNGILKETLGLGCYETYGCIWRGIEGMWEGDFAGFQAPLVGHEFFCGQNEPYRFGV